MELEDHQMGPLEMAWFPMNMEAVGAAGSLVKGEGRVPSVEGTLVYFSAPDLVDTLERVKEKGRTALMEKTSIGEHGFIALVQDIEGNRIGLRSME